MDAQVIMSATASPKVSDKVAGLGYWSGFAAVTDPRQIVVLVSQAVERPRFSIKSSLKENGELRFQLEGRIGLAGFVNQGEVEIAFPFLRGGHQYEMEIARVGVHPDGLTKWITASFCGIEVTFFDALHTTSRAKYAPGETHPFFLNAFALSLKRVQPQSDAVVWDGELPFPTTGYRIFLSSPRRQADQLIFQCPLEAEPQGCEFNDRSFAILPLSLTEEGKTLIDVCVALEVLQELGSPLKVGEEVAGVIWLQGYCPHHLKPSK